MFHHGSTFAGTESAHRCAWLEPAGESKIDKPATAAAMRTDRVFVYEMPAQIEKMKSIRRFSSEWILLIITLMISLSDFSNCEAASFNFVEFAYKETSKNELTYQEFEQACQQSPECQQAEGVALEHCVRNCISPSCYQDLYKFDELEEGEIDVRLNSFKGCFIQRLNRQRS